MTSVIWVRTEPSASGRTYVVTVNLHDDHAVTLKPTEAAEHARHVLAAAMHAAHDAAVFQQLDERDLEREHVVATIAALRNDRAPLRGLPSVGLKIDPGINAQGQPFLRLSLPGGLVGQWSIEDARQHAHNVLEAVAAAELDAAYYRHLVGTIGLDEETARAAVGDLLGRVS